MKVLHITNSLQTGGAEKLLLESIPRLNDSQIKTDLLLLSGNNEPFLKSLRSINSSKIFCLSKTKIYNPLFILKIIPYLRRYNIVHVHLFPALYWAGIAKFLSFSKVKMIYTEHNTTNRRRRKLIFKYSDRLIYSNYKKIVTISPEVDENIKTHLGVKVENNKFVLIPNGVNIEAIKNAIPIKKSEISSVLDETSKVILQVSSFTPQKDQKTVIEALQFLPKDFFCCFVGDGPTKNECYNLAKDLGLLERVIFLGIRTDVFRLLKSVDFIVLSSHFEGLSLASIEGMASGKPFIASNVPGLGNIVEGAGILFSNGDSYELSKIIAELDQNMEYSAKIVKACQQKAMEYDLKLMIGRMIKLYNDIINN